MKKFSFGRLLLILLDVLLMGAVFVTISYLYLNSLFSYSYINESEYYDVSAYLNDDSFEDSEIFTEIYTHELQDIITYSAVRSQIELKEITGSDGVNVLNYALGFDYETYGDKKVVYSVDNLIKWGRQGFTYTKETFSLDEFLDYYDSDLPFDYIKAGVSDGLTYLTGEDGITQVSVTLLNPAFETIDGISDLTAVADDWIEYFKIRDSIINAAEHYAEYYELYKDGQVLYGTSPINLCYVLRIGNGDNTITYSNCIEDDFDPYTVSDDELNDFFSDKRNYVIYYPDSLEYLTFSNVNETNLYTYTRLYSNELGNDFRLWAYVNDDYTLDGDAFAQSYNIINSRRSQVHNERIVIAVLSTVCFLLFSYLLFTAGVKTGSKKETYLLFIDKIFIEIPLALLILVIILTIYFFRLAEDGYDSPLLLYGDLAYYALFALFGILISCCVIHLTFSFVRRLRNHCFGDHCLIVLLYRFYCYCRDRLERSNNLLLSSVLPYTLYIVTNLGLFAIAVRCLYIHRIIFFILIILAIIAIDVSIGIRKYRTSADRRAIFEGIRRLSDGELDYKVDRDKFLELNSELADQVNNIGDGIRNAVSISMKDEKMKSDLITNVSHDLKTPLTSIINYVNLLKDENITKEPAAGYIKTLDEKSVRLKMLLEDLIEASKLSSGNIEVNFAKIGINELLRQVVGEYSDKLDELKLTVIFDGETDKKIMADGRLMWRIMDNLFGNIIKYSLPGTRVYISLTESDTKVNISIKNVSAIQNTVQGSELTEKFIRGDSSRSTEGSGLGLFIAKSLTEVQKGEFSVVADGDLFKANLTFDKVV